MDNISLNKASSYRRSAASLRDFLTCGKTSEKRVRFQHLRIRLIDRIYVLTGVGLKSRLIINWRKTREISWVNFERARVRSVIAPCEENHVGRAILV